MKHRLASSELGLITPKSRLLIFRYLESQCYSYNLQFYLSSVSNNMSQFVFFIQIYIMCIKLCTLLFLKEDHEETFSSYRNTPQTCSLEVLLQHYCHV